MWKIIYSIDHNYRDSYNRHACDKGEVGSCSGETLPEAYIALYKKLEDEKELISILDNKIEPKNADYFLNIHSVLEVISTTGTD